MRRIESPIIVVLGAPNDDQGRLLPAAEGRAQTALREYHRNPSCPLLLLGGFGAHFNRTSRPHFDYLAEFLEAGGVPRSAILGKLPTFNTIDDARKSAEFLADERGLALRVVTSDFHATRARLLFERAFAGRASVEIVAAPTALPPDQLAPLLRHEADAVARLATEQS